MVVLGGGAFSYERGNPVGIPLGDFTARCTERALGGAYPEGGAAFSYERGIPVPRVQST